MFVLGNVRSERDDRREQSHVEENLAARFHASGHCDGAVRELERVHTGITLVHGLAAEKTISDRALLRAMPDRFQSLDRRSRPAIPSSSRLIAPMQLRIIRQHECRRLADSRRREHYTRATLILFSLPYS